MTASAIASDTTYSGTSSCGASTSESPGSQRSASRNERGEWPASKARRMTFSPSAMNRPRSVSIALRSDVSRNAT